MRKYHRAKELEFTDNSAGRYSDESCKEEILLTYVSRRIEIGTDLDNLKTADVTQAFQMK